MGKCHIKQQLQETEIEVW